MNPTQESQGYPRQTPQTLALYGGGRSADWRWPIWAMDNSSHAGLDMRVSCRFIGETAFGLGNGNIGGVGSVGSTFVNNLPCAQFVTGVVNVSGGFVSSNSQLAPRFPIVKGQNAVPSSCDDYAVWRDIAIMSFDAIPTIDCDYGHCLFVPANDVPLTIIKEAQQGIAWYRTADGNVTLYINGPAGIVKVPVAIAGFDATLIHAYELQFYAATMAADALLVALVDGAILTAISWASGKLPVPNPAYMQWKACIVDLCGAGGHLNVYQWILSTGATLQAIS